MFNIFTYFYLNSSVVTSIPIYLRGDFILGSFSDVCVFLKVNANIRLKRSYPHKYNEIEK